MTKTLEKQQESNVLLRAKQLLKEGVFNQKTLAEKAGCSQTTISQWLKSEYPGDVNKLENQISQFLSIHSQRSRYQKLNLGFVETSVADRLFSIAKMCQLNSEVGVAYGTSGLGKSTAIKNYAIKNPGVLIIDPDENASAKSILESLAEQLGIRGLSKNYELAREIQKRLLNSGFLVIVDESENLKSLCFRTLRKLHDRCDFTFGILFVGTEWLYRKLNMMKGDLAYLTSRIGYWEALDNLKQKDVELLVRQAIPNCSDDNIQSFLNLTRRNARVLFNTLKRVRDIQQKYGEELNYDIIKTAVAMTQG